MGKQGGGRFVGYRGRIDEWAVWGVKGSEAFTKGGGVGARGGRAEVKGKGERNERDKKKWWNGGGREMREREVEEGEGLWGEGKSVNEGGQQKVGLKRVSGVKEDEKR